MGRKFIKQIINQDFVYPNADVSEYDVEIVHDLNNNSVSGTVANFSATTVNATGITFSYSYTWSLNGAEPFINDFNNLNFMSVHCMGPTQQYYKPWRLVGVPLLDYTGQTSTSGTLSFTVRPENLGLTTLSNGVYYFEVRMIGHRAIFPISVEYTVSTLPTPTPTPTSTPTPPTPTPTPTPTPGPSIYTSGATLNVTDTGWIKYTNNSGSTTYFQCTSLGTQVLTDCLVCSSINVGIPFADLANFTITNCGNTCGGAPGPTPTPTPTGGGSYYYYTVDVYDCFPCSLIGPAVARVSTPLNLTFFYNIGDGNVYQVTGNATGPAYDIDLDGYASHPDCNLACSL